MFRSPCGAAALFRLRPQLQAWLLCCALTLFSWAGVNASAATLNRVDPQRGPVGCFVTLSGTGLKGVSRVSFNGRNAPAFEANSDTRITVRVPQGATSGAIQVTAASGNAVGELFTVTSTGRPVVWGNGYSNQLKMPPTLRDVTAVAAGGLHSMVLRSDGTVDAWGYNMDNRATVPPGVADVVAIACGYSHNLVLKSDGTVFGWGRNDYGESSVPSTLGGVVAIAAGGYHSLALKKDGSVVAWGNNSHGQASIPAGLKDVVAIAACGTQSMALDSSGKVAVWGENSEGQTDVPEGLTDVKSITCTYRSCLAIKNDGSIVTWGSNSFGEREVPTSLGKVLSVTGGYSHYLAVRNNGIAVGWGFNEHGETTIPAGLENVIAVTGGESHSLALAAYVAPTLVRIDSGRGPAGSLAILTGKNFSGATRVTFNGISAPEFVVKSDTRMIVRVPAGATSGPVQVATAGGSGNGSGVRFTVTPAANVAAWGSNSDGQTAVPPTLGNVTALSAGIYHSVALKADGTVSAWGYNESGESTVPAGLANVDSIASGYFHTLALSRDGTITGWGSNVINQTQPPTNVIDVVAIAAGGFFSMALQGDGTVAVWGNIAPVPADLKDVVAIAAGVRHSLALTSDGIVVAWGANGFGQASVPSGLDNVIAIAAGFDYSVALKQDGTVVAWGDTTGGRTSVPAGLDNVVAITAGRYHALALKSNGTVVAWGDNSATQSDVPAGLGQVFAISAGGAHNLVLRDKLPSVAVVSPSNLEVLKLLTAINVTAAAKVGGAKITGVTVALKRRSSSGGMEYWGYRNGNWGWAAKQAVFPAAIVGGSSWTVNTNLPSGSELIDGPYYVAATALDSMGNLRTSVSNTFTIDTQVPSVSIATPANQSIVNKLSSVTGGANDNIGGGGIAKVNISLRRTSDLAYWNGSAWGADIVQLPTLLSGLKWSKSSELPLLGPDPTTKLTDGSYTVTAMAYDKAGNSSSSATCNFSVDHISPGEVSITTPVHLSTVKTFTSVAGTAVDNAGGSGLGKVDLTLRRVSDLKFWNGATWATAATQLPATISGTKWTRGTGWPLAGADTDTQLLEGKYTVIATAYDKAGNRAAVTGRSDFTVDRTAPTVAITNPVDGGVVASLTTLKGMAYDAVSGVANVNLTLRRLSDRLYWNGSEWAEAVATLTTPAKPSTTGNSSWSYGSLTQPMPQNEDLSDGVYVLQARSVDKAGNLSGVISSRFTLKRTTGASNVVSEEVTTSRLQLSAASATADGRVQMVFTGALDAYMAVDTARYAVAHDGISVGVESAQSAASGTVVLGLEEGAVQAGDRLRVTYDLRDASGRSLRGEASVIVR